MKRKIFVALTIVIITALIIPGIALAVDVSGDTYDITGHDNETINITAGATVTLTGSAANTKIVCGAGVTLTLDNVDINNSANYYTCALGFTGIGNTLTLVGNSTLRSGLYEPGIRVEGSTALEINGIGTINVTGGSSSAGIGGGETSNGGVITISGGTITAQGGSGGAGIGSGDGFFASSALFGANITMSGGRVTAIGGNSAAGIGGGASSNGGNITISGGDITAQGGNGGAGIGSGDGFFDACSGGTITVSGGSVSAIGGVYGAGIGGGFEGSAGSISISGGNIFAQRGSTYTNDIGNGYSASGGTLGISGSAAVFLKNNSCITPTTTTHTRMGVTTVSNAKLFGISIPNGWTSTAAYIIPFTITYNENGGAGTLPSALTQHLNTTMTVGESRFVTKGDQYAASWNTQADGGGVPYLSGSTLSFTEDLTLYATAWQDIKHVTGVTINSATVIIEDNESTTVSATVLPADATYPEITWTSSDETIVGVDQNGNITAVDGGVATITATADGQSGTCIVTVNPADNGTYDISKYGSGTTITIGAGYTVTITNTGGVTYANMRIVCKAGAELTIDGVKINDSSNVNVCALSFIGSGNTLTLTGSSTLSSGLNEPGIRVEDSTELEIGGAGSINVTGGGYGAGIGGGKGSAGGSITISGGTVTATGGRESIYGCAGIGGGLTGSGGNITITGGVVTATSQLYGAGIGSGDGYNGAINTGNITITGGIVTATGGNNSGSGIGGGFNSDNGNVTISGGTVTATGGGNGAGIGGNTCTITINGGEITAIGGSGGAGIGGRYGKSSNVIISGGTIKATGGYYGAGIGSGYNGTGGTIDISGGEVFAAMGTDGQHDVGDGKDASGSVLTISGNSVLFLKNDSFVLPITDTHTHIEPMPVIDGMIFDITMPSGWTSSGAYILACQLTYDNNGGTGADTETLRQGMSVAVKDDSGFSRERYSFGGWNTKADGSGDSYASGDTLLLDAADITLYAVWNEIRVDSIALSSDAVIMIQGDTIVMTTIVLPSNSTHTIITWTSSDISIATIDQSGKIKAVGIGSAVITATVDGKSDTCSVTVNPKNVTSIRLNLISKTLTIGDTVKLTSTVFPDDATYPAVTWKSSNTSVANVDKYGRVTAVSEGGAVITATADGKTAKCYIEVEEAAPAPTPTPTPTTAPTPTVMPTPTLTPTSREISLDAVIVEENEDTREVIIEISVVDLPSGTESIQLPGGEIITLNGSDTIRFSIDVDNISENGAVTIIALDNEGTPLASADIQIDHSETIIVPDAGNAFSGIWLVLLWVLVGLLGISVIAVVVFLIIKKNKMGTGE